MPESREKQAVVLDLQKIRTEIEEKLKGQTHIFRISKERQEIDGNSPGVLAMFDSKGVGPAGLFFIGRKAAYVKKNYIDWFMSRISTKGGTIHGL
ncbi:MAG: hypothetical protein WCR46_14500 [Deltaproteobacteria bacterium]|jgi:hypothetical protein